MEWEGRERGDSLVPVVDLGLHQVVDHGQGVLRKAGYVHTDEDKSYCQN